MKHITDALEHSQRMLFMIIKNIEQGEDLLEGEKLAIRHYVNALKMGCECDSYNGFDCGCTHRSFLNEEAIKELESI